MRKTKYSLLLDDARYDLIILSLIEMKNHLIREGHYADAIDDALLNVLNAKKKYISL